MLIVSPDRPCYEAIFSGSDLEHKEVGLFRPSSQKLPPVEFIVRDGASGSFTEEWIIPSATLRTADGAPVNPTGAGNAYSAAYVACRASGSSVEHSATLATAVGAVVCEYEHLPPWSWAVIERIAEAACEVRDNVRRR